jgi:hypothetical protein
MGSPVYTFTELVRVYEMVKRCEGFVFLQMKEKRRPYCIKGREFINLIKITI